MASPQPDKFVKISTELLEALCRTPLGGARNSVFLAIMRKTYGWNKKQDLISISQIQELTGLSRRSVIYAMQNLEAGKFIKVKRGLRGQINSLGINKNYDQWVVQEKAPKYKQTIEKQKERYRERVVQETETSARNDQGSARNGQKVVQETVLELPFLAPTIDTITIYKQKNSCERKKRSPVHPVKAFIDFFHDTYLECEGVKPNITSKDAKLAKQLLAKYPIESLKNWARAFFYTDDKFVQEAGHSFGVFFSVIEKLSTGRIKARTEKIQVPDAIKAWSEIITLKRKNSLNQHDPPIHPLALKSIQTLGGMEKILAADDYEEQNLAAQFKRIYDRVKGKADAN